MATQPFGEGVDAWGTLEVLGVEHLTRNRHTSTTGEEVEAQEAIPHNWREQEVIIIHTGLQPDAHKMVGSLGTMRKGGNHSHMRISETKDRSAGHSTYLMATMSKSRLPLQHARSYNFCVALTLGELLVS